MLVADELSAMNDGSVALRLATSDADLVAEVSDTGIGIPADRQGRVFGVFERVNEDRSEASGTGPGLALAKQFVKLHGGSIGFTSVPVAVVLDLRLPDGRGEQVLSRWLAGVRSSDLVRAAS